MALPSLSQNLLQPAVLALPTVPMKALQDVRMKVLPALPPFSPLPDPKEILKGLLNTSRHFQSARNLQRNSLGVSCRALTDR
jgi:hypothetical protein